MKTKYFILLPEEETKIHYFIGLTLPFWAVIFGFDKALSKGHTNECTDYAYDIEEFHHFYMQNVRKLEINFNL